MTSSFLLTVFLASFVAINCVQLLLLAYVEWTFKKGILQVIRDQLDFLRPQPVEGQSDSEFEHEQKIIRTMRLFKTDESGGYHVVFESGAVAFLELEDLDKSEG